MLAAVGGTVVNPTATQTFINFLGILQPATATESLTQFYCLAAGTWKNMACYISENTFDETKTVMVRNRISNSNGSMVISIPGGGHTGYFEADATLSDSVDVGDLLNYGFTSDGSSGGIEVVWIGAHFYATDTTLCMIGGSGTGNVGFNQTYYGSLFGGGALGLSTMPRATGLFPYALNASRYTNYITDTDPPNSGASTFSLMKNGSASGLAVTSGAGETGYFMISDIDSVGFDVGHTCANQVAGAGASGTSVTWASAALLLKASA